MISICQFAYLPISLVLLMNGIWFLLTRVTNEELVHTIYLCHVTTLSKSGRKKRGVREGGKKMREEWEQRKKRSIFALGLLCSIVVRDLSL